MTERVRLQKFLAEAGVASRRRAEEMIQAGRVRVDGIVVTELGSTVDPDSQQVEVDGTAVRRADRLVYYAFHKPRGYLVTASDDFGRKTIYDLLKHIPERVIPVGRLDMDSEGLLILTNDGELAHRLMHPRYQIEKEYEVEVEGIVSDAGVRMLETGVVIEDKVTNPAKVKIMKHNSDSTTARIIISEGRKRQVRLMFEAVGNPVKRLTRIREGSLELGMIRRGATRPLTREEVAALREEVGLPATSGRS